MTRDMVFTDAVSYSIGNLDESSPRVCPDPRVAVPLKQHQLADICRMRELEQVSEHAEFLTHLGTFTNKVGAGKTASMVAHLCTASEPARFSIPLGQPHGLLGRRLPQLEEILSFDLVAVPHILITQWSDCFQKFVPSLRVLTVSRKIHIPDRVSEYTHHDVVLVSSSMFSFVQEQLVGYRVRRFVVDEADTIRLGTGDVRATFVWLMSGTPFHLYSGAARSAIIRKMTTGTEDYKIVDAITVRSTDAFVDASFVIPEATYRTVACRAPLYMHIVGSVISPASLECLHAGDVDGALQHIRNMGLEVNRGDGIVVAVTKAMQATKRNLVLNIESTRLMNLSDRERDARLRRLEQQLDTIENRIAGVEERMASIRTGSSECPICYDDIRQPTAILTCCQNAFCYACVGRAAQQGVNKCPMCRALMTKASMVVMSDTGHGAPAVETPDVPRMPTKDEALEELIRSEPNGKFLVFSNYEASFERVERAFPHARKITGNANRVKAVLDGYKAEGSQILLINSRLFGAGLDLEDTTHIVFYHRMDDSTESQVIGRAQRPGRTCALQVVYLVHETEPAGPV